MPAISRARRFAAAIALVSAVQPAAAAECGFQHAFSRLDEGGTRTVKVFRAAPVAALGGVRPMLFLSDLKVNTDGTKISYHQNDPTGRRCQQQPSASPCAINNIRNAYRDHTRPESDFTAVRDAGYPLPRTWQVLSPNIIERRASNGKPCLTADGYLVSMTADVAVPGGFNRVGDCDPSKWIDALTIPAIVLPKAAPGNPSQFVQTGMQKRSLALAFSSSATRRASHGIVGDFGPARELGEASIAMNRELNGLPATDRPKHRQDAIVRFQARRSAILLFPGASFVVARPLAAAAIATRGADAMTKFGGVDKLYRCIRDEIDPAF